MRACFISLIAILLFCGCRSAEDAYLDGQRAENMGNLRAAVNYYIEAVRLAPEMIQAKSKVADVGERVMADYMNKAKSSNRNGRGRDALSYLTQAESLERQARPIAANVKRPSSYASIKSEAQQIIITQLLADAQKAERAAPA